jgi:hypothetical protein
MRETGSGEKSAHRRIPLPSRMLDDTGSSECSPSFQLPISRWRGFRPPLYYRAVFSLLQERVGPGRTRTFDRRLVPSRPSGYGSAATTRLQIVCRAILHTPDLGVCEALWVLTSEDPRRPTWPSTWGCADRWCRRTSLGFRLQSPSPGGPRRKWPLTWAYDFVARAGFEPATSGS